MTIRHAAEAVSRYEHQPFAGPPVCVRCSEEQGREVRHYADRQHKGECTRKGCVADAIIYQGKPGLFCPEHSIERLFEKQATRRELFIAYNAAKSLVKAGRFEAGRLNRALGITMRKEPRPYITTIDHCDCPDSVGRQNIGIVCKHRIAAMLKTIATEQVNKR